MIVKCSFFPLFLVLFELSLSLWNETANKTQKQNKEKCFNGFKFFSLVLVLVLVFSPFIHLASNINEALLIFIDDDDDDENEIHFYSWCNLSYKLSNCLCKIHLNIFINLNEEI